MSVTAIVGGGASGLTAACFAASDNNKVILFESNPRVGKKLLVTGNGRCNLSNTDMGSAHYHGTDPSFPSHVLKEYGRERTLEFFRSLGLMTAEGERGRLYPFSDHANSVVDILRLAAAERGVDMHADEKVLSAEKKGEKFLIKTGEGVYEADALIIAAGGAAGTRHGGTRDGYSLLRSFGHTITDLYPSIVPLKTDNTYTKSLKGVRCDAAVYIKVGEDVKASSAGEVQFTEYGVSGPAAFEVSRCADTLTGAAVTLDLMRGCTREEIIAILKDKKERFPSFTFEDLLTGVLHNRLGRTVLRYCGYRLDMPVTGLDDDMAADIADGIKNFELPLKGTCGFDAAQVTAGGADTSEFDPETLESKLVPGLYAAGEVLDVDGDCGGYNLQWAWSSGMCAGMRCCK